MALIARQDLPKRFRQIARELRLEVIRAVGDGARDIAQAGAVESPVDTGRLASNFLVGSFPFDFTYRPSFREGKDGSFRLQALGLLFVHNKNVVQREFRRASSSVGAGRVFHVSVQNNTPYLRYVEERRPFVERATRGAILRMRATYRALRLRLR